MASLSVAMRPSRFSRHERRYAASLRGPSHHNCWDSLAHSRGASEKLLIQAPMKLFDLGSPEFTMGVFARWREGKNGRSGGWEMGGSG